jgi:hypothetical protein
MKPVVPLPSEELVRAACKEYEGDVADLALKELFTQYPTNKSYSHVLLKVVTLNRLYSTSIYAVYDAATHIHERAEEIDSALAAGSPEIVDTIAALTLSATGKKRHVYSFASKFCSWHKQDKYPIWDSRVRRYLSALRRQLKNTDDAGLLGTNPDLWTLYPEFVELITGLRRRYRLAGFSFKDIDKFLWKYGRDPKDDAASIKTALVPPVP